MRGWSPVSAGGGLGCAATVCTLISYILMQCASSFIYWRFFVAHAQAQHDAGWKQAHTHHRLQESTHASRCRLQSCVSLTLFLFGFPSCRLSNVTYGLSYALVASQLIMAHMVGDSLHSGLIPSFSVSASKTYGFGMVSLSLSLSLSRHQPLGQQNPSVSVSFSAITSHTRLWSAAQM